MNSSLLPVFLLMICLVGLLWPKSWREKLIAKVFSLIIWLLLGLTTTPISQAYSQKSAIKELKFLTSGQNEIDDKKKTQKKKRKKQSDEEENSDEEEDDDDNRKTGKKR